MKATLKVHFQSPYVQYNNQDFEITSKKGKFTTLNINGVETDFLNSEILPCNPYNTLEEFISLCECEIEESPLPYFSLRGKLVNFTNVRFMDCGSGEEYFLLKEKHGDYKLISFSYEPDCDGAYYSSYFLDFLNLKNLDREEHSINQKETLSLLLTLNQIHNENKKDNEKTRIIQHAPELFQGLKDIRNQLLDGRHYKEDSILITSINNLINKIENDDNEND